MSTVGTRWKLMSVCAELRADVVDVVRHAPQDRVGHRLGRVAARRPVAVQLLDPFEIDDRHDADLEVDVLGDIDLVGDDRAVQAFVEQEVGARRELAPGREGARARRRECSASPASWT